MRKRSYRRLDPVQEQQPVELVELVVERTRLEAFGGDDLLLSLGAPAPDDDPRRPHDNQSFRTPVFKCVILGEPRYKVFQRGSQLTVGGLIVVIVERIDAICET